MPHPNAVKGASWERFCSKLLGVPRTLSKGKHDDRGDLEDSAFIYECKYDNSRSPLQWWKQAEAARARGTQPWSIVLAKTACMTGKPKVPGDPEGWAIMSIEQWQELREYMRLLEKQLERRAG